MLVTVVTLAVLVATLIALALRDRAAERRRHSGLEGSVVGMRITLGSVSPVPGGEWRPSDGFD